MAQGRFSEAEVIAMRVMRLAGVSYGKIAAAFEASCGTIKPAIDGQTHKGVLFPAAEDVDKIHQDKAQALKLADRLLHGEPEPEPVQAEPDGYQAWDHTPYAKQRLHGLRHMQINGPQVRFIRRASLPAKEIAGLIPTFQGTHLTPATIQAVRAHQMCKWVSDMGHVWQPGEAVAGWQE